MSSSAKKSVRLYRIMDFTRVVQIFERRELYFAHPTTWDDPYEMRLNHKHSHLLFAQCWCQLAVSDAMWRIYSPNGMGVRISTTKAKLRAAVKAWAAPKGYKWRGEEVEYMSQSALEKSVRAIKDDLVESFSISRAADTLYLKRNAFAHESEWRATIYCPDDGNEDLQVPPSPGLAMPVDPNALIDRILLDPRAPSELVNAFQFFFKEKLKFPGEVTRSVLYKSPFPMNVDDDEL
jgi:hypothetical protein